MNGPDAQAPARREDNAVEPEVLDWIEEAERASRSGPGGAHGPFGRGGPFDAHGPHGPVRPLGCTVGPGCGCLGLPLALLAGAVISALMAVLWLLSLGRVPVSIVQMVQRLRRGRGRG
jgi:hypothetical protein